ncbi:MAG: hypothetical protein GY820_28905 [Gammaproteobacteria bacterium]|nr:hypothetical protein [Gammaproteobacteria bacterium]
MKAHNRILFCILLLCSFSIDASIFVEQPSRSFGYFIGDIVEQRIHLQTDGNNIELAGIPDNQRVGQWLERLSSTLTTDNLGQGLLVLKYQVINAPSALVNAALPALSLEAVGGELISISPWPISISPLASVVMPDRDELLQIQPDRQAVVPDADPPSRRLTYTGIMLIATILMWLAWWLWRQYTDVVQLPFARSFDEIRKLDSVQTGENQQAWFVLHHAFNDAASRTISNSTIGELIQQQPWLKPLQSRIENFYAASDACFFEQSTQPQAIALIEFARALYLAERRNSGGRLTPSGR